MLKRILSLGLVCLMLLCLCSCSKTDNDPSIPEISTQPTQKPDATPGTKDETVTVWLLSSTSLANSVGGKPYETYTYTYDSNYNLVERRHVRTAAPDKPNITQYTYNDKGYLVQSITTFPMSESKQGSSYEYDDAGNLIMTASLLQNRPTDELIVSNKQLFTYDDAGRLLSKEIPEIMRHEYEYAEDGLSQTNRIYDHRNNFVAYATITNNADGLPVSCEYYYCDYGDHFKLSHFETFTYDANGNLISWTRTEPTLAGDRTIYNHTYVYEYDSQGNLTRKTHYKKGSTVNGGTIVDEVYTYISAEVSPQQALLIQKNNETLNGRQIPGEDIF